MLVHEFMNTANIVNIFIITKLFVQKIILVHEFMNITPSMNTLAFDLFAKIHCLVEIRSLDFS